ncbi:hypothetical protein PROPEN_00162 [Proteus penneri ATCC 35198]|nr:hypothetical protein PROPEN_00162 [Proteus penneri ATCC 35198]
MNNQSQKYDRTYHYPFSPGTTNDDRINAQWWQDICQIKQLIHTEKLDGENNCLNKMGVLRVRMQLQRNQRGHLNCVNVGK